jgi:hypothetical protein
MNAVGEDVILSEAGKLRKTKATCFLSYVEDRAKR